MIDAGGSLNQLAGAAVPPPAYLTRADEDHGGER
jgi:hypothetical protein